MPLPKPNPGEKRQMFLNRCMDNETMRTEYPGEDQRFAVCQSQWEAKKKGLSEELGKASPLTQGESTDKSATSEEPKLVTLQIGRVVHESFPKWK